MTASRSPIIDTGLDYYHANFGGSGDPADFAADNGLTIGTPAFPNTKVIGGTDFVGDAYDAGADGAAQPSRIPTQTRSTATATAATSVAPRPGSA